MNLIRQTQLHFREGNSDKDDEVDLCETDEKFVVNFRYGRRGAGLKEGTKTVAPVSREQAETIFQKLVDEKTKKGWKRRQQRDGSRTNTKTQTNFFHTRRNAQAMRFFTI
jgi:predicted DNA-binding WGR domain protein